VQAQVEKSTDLNGGFTLIELLIVVAVIAILAVIALPSYQQYVVRSHRSQAQQFMVQVASKQEQYLSNNRDYTSSLTDLGLSVPAEVSDDYTIAVTRLAGPPVSYRITATPVSTGTQASDGTLSLNGDGTRSPAGKWD
jgi:type IV pilus assembly protein PilE